MPTSEIRPFLLARIAENRAERLQQLIDESTPPGQELAAEDLRRLRGTFAWASIGVTFGCAEIRVHMTPDAFLKAEARRYSDHPDFDPAWTVED